MWLCVWISASHLSRDLQRSFPSILSADGELSGLAEQAAGLLQPRPVRLNLRPHNQHRLFQMHRGWIK